MSITGERGGQNRPASGVERALLTDGRGTSDDFPDPFGKHDMEWWVWDGGLLIPATDGNVYANEEYERSQVALRRLAATERSQRALRYRDFRRLTVFVRTLRVVLVWRRDETIRNMACEPRPAAPERVGETK